MVKWVEALTPSLKTSSCSEPTRWKERMHSCRLSSALHKHATPHMYPHTHKHAQDTQKSKCDSNLSKGQTQTSTIVYSAENVSGDVNFDLLGCAFAPRTCIIYKCIIPNWAWLIPTLRRQRQTDLLIRSQLGLCNKILSKKKITSSLSKAYSRISLWHFLHQISRQGLTM